MTTCGTPPSTPVDGGTRGADASEALLAGLRSDGAERRDAVNRLHGLLLRAAHFEVGRRRAALAHVRGEEIGDLATQAADDALVAVLAKLDDYRGESRFTTWAYKFALLEASVRTRRRAWQDREVVLEPGVWPGLPSQAAGPEEHAEQGELLALVQELVRTELTPHQRRVLVALAMDGVPIDVMAERLSTTRGALYKTLHDARRKLRRCVAEAGRIPEPDGE